MRRLRAALLAALPFLAGCFTRGSLAVDPLAPQRELFARGAFSQAAAELNPEALARLPRRRRSEGYALLARSLEAAGRLDAALSAYQYGEALYPDNLELVSGLAWLLHRQGLDDRARPLFERIVSIHPNNASGSLGLAEILRDQGDFAQAQLRFETALSEAGWAENAAIQRDYAELLADRQLFEPAARAAEKSLALARTPDTLIVAARIARRRGRPEEPYAMLADALALDPARDEARSQKALWLLEDARLSDAAAEAESLLARAPGDPLAHWVRGAARARLGDFPGARADLGAAAARRRDAPFIARAALAFLQELHAAAD
ncbi:MAG: tetratricopeptide repeat protein [Elusimicrobia bacterium]|nr:tetratricopeptide repeat protein [Elusimicrobiota bacterium]